MENTSTPFSVGGTGATLQANAGVNGGNGGIISITNLGSGAINISTPSSNLQVNPAPATQASNGGTGGSIYLNALGKGGTVAQNSGDCGTRRQ